MLQLRQLSLVQFKNYSNRSFSFEKRVIAVCGNNGTGKTNLLDAIYYLCFTKSYLTRQEGANVQRGAAGFRLQGEFILHDSPEKTTCIFRENGKKEFSVNDKAYERFSHHIGRYPCVIIAPDDAALITGDSRERRHFLDTLLCQLDADYLQQLIQYKKVLEQRNSLLRQFAETGQRNDALLEVLDGQLAAPGTLLFDRRKAFMVQFLPLVKKLYQEIAGKPEDVSLFYESELLNSSFPAMLAQNRMRDLYAQRTTGGIHRDDIEIQLSGQSFKAMASQGQRKSLLFALKLAEMETLRKEKHFSPLLLLDDVFEKLDEERISNLLHRVCVENDGQVFITDTNAERLREHFGRHGIAFEMVECG